MTVYEALINEDKQPSCRPLNPCCEEPCDEPSFWDSLPQCRLNWIALGLAALAIGFGLIGLGYINIGTIFGIITVPVILPSPFVNPTYLTQGSLLISIFLGIIGVFAWIIFKPCSDDWKIVVVGSLLGASGFSLAAIGLLYFTVAQFPTGFDPTWFNIAIPLIIASIVGFLLLAYLINANRCYGCITAKKAVIVSLIFLSAGWAAWYFGRLLYVAVATFQFSEAPTISPYMFPSSAFMAFIAVSIINIVLVVALGWYVLGCAADNCFTVFLPLFASAAPLGNWALYQVGLNVVSYIGILFPSFPPATIPFLTQFAYAIGFVSITALLLTFVIANGAGDAFIVPAASAITVLYAIGAYTFVASASNLLGSGDFVNSILQGIFSGIAITAALSLLNFRIKSTLPKIIYGLASGTFGWAIIYLYSTYSSDVLNFFFPATNIAIRNIGLRVIISVAVIAVLYVQFVVCDELLGAITFANIALLTVGAAGFTGTIAYYQAGSPFTSPLNPPDIRAATIIYVAYALTALFLPPFFVKCGGIKRQVVLAVASLAFGIAAIDFGRAVAFARALVFSATNVAVLTFPPLVYIASVVGVTLAGQFTVWAYPQANLYTAFIANFVGPIAGGMALQVSFLVGRLNNRFAEENIKFVAVPWLVFALAIVALLLFLETKSLCIPQHCRFLPGLLIPALGIAVFGRVAPTSAVYGAVYNLFSPGVPAISYLTVFALNSRLILVNSIIPLAGLLLSLQAFKCTSSLAYLPSSIAYSGVVYVASQFEVYPFEPFLAGEVSVKIYTPLLNLINTIYAYLDLTVSNPTTIADNATFITQVNLLYILFLAPALITAFASSCSKPISAAVIGTSIAAAAISFGAVGIANVLSGVLLGIGGTYFSYPYKHSSAPLAWLTSLPALLTVPSSMLQVSFSFLILTVS